MANHQGIVKKLQRFNNFPLYKIRRAKCMVLKVLLIAFFQKLLDLLGDEVLVTYTKIILRKKFRKTAILRGKKHIYAYM